MTPQDDFILQAIQALIVAAFKEGDIDNIYASLDSYDTYIMNIHARNDFKQEEKKDDKVIQFQS